MEVIRKKSSSGSTTENIIIFEETPHFKSRASYELLKNELILKDEDFLNSMDAVYKWLDYRETYLEKIKKENGDIVCTECGKEHLEIGTRNNDENDKNSNLAIIMHLDTTLNKFDVSNFKIVCKKCHRIIRKCHTLKEKLNVNPDVEMQEPDFHVYTDCSIRNKKIHYGVLVVDNNGKEFKIKDKIDVEIYKKNFNKYQSFHKTSFKNNDSNLGEIVAIYEAVKLFANSKKCIHIFTDSESAFSRINGIQRVKNNPKGELIKNILFEMRTVLKYTNIDVMWVKGHENCWGNIEVDNLVGEDVSINESDYLNLVI